MTAQHKGNQSEESYLKNQSPNCPRFQENINTCSSTSVNHYNSNPRIGINLDNTFPEREPRLCRRKYCLRVLSGDVDLTDVYQLPTSSAEDEFKSPVHLFSPMRARENIVTYKEKIVREEITPLHTSPSATRHQYLSAKRTHSTPEFSPYLIRATFSRIRKAW